MAFKLFKLSLALWIRNVPRLFNIITFKIYSINTMTLIIMEVICVGLLYLSDVPNVQELVF